MILERTGTTTQVNGSGIFSKTDFILRNKAFFPSSGGMRPTVTGIGGGAGNEPGSMHTLFYLLYYDDDC